jgi:hypothetical protein
VLPSWSDAQNVPHLKDARMKPEILIVLAGQRRHQMPAASGMKD